MGADANNEVPVPDDHSPAASQDAPGEASDAVAELEDLLGEVSLYIDWHYVTRQLTTPQKERFADAVQAASARLNAGTEVPARSPERWWRD